MENKKLFVDYFVDSVFVEKFNESLRECLSKIQQRTMAKYCSPENAQRLKHGVDFSNPAAPQVFNGGVETHATHFEISLESIIAHDVSALENCFISFQKEMGEQFIRMVYSTISKACDQSGNVVDANKSGSLSLAFLEMLEKLEFCIDKNGVVSFPDIHLGTDAFNEFTKEMQEATPEFNELLESVKGRKIAEAQEREILRKSKFARYGDSSI